MFCLHNAKRSAQFENAQLEGIIWELTGLEFGGGDSAYWLVVDGAVVAERTDGVLVARQALRERVVAADLVHAYNGARVARSLACNTISVEIYISVITRVRTRTIQDLKAAY